MERMSNKNALLELVKYQQRELKAKQTAIEYLNKELEEIKEELYSIKIRQAIE